MSKRLTYGAKPITWDIDSNGCFVVTSHIWDSRNRYPGFTRNGVRRQMSRYFYEECFGEIPEGMVIMHTCDNTGCINPEHLKTGTHSENIIDMYEKGRYKRTAPYVKGEKSGRAKLNEKQVRELRKRSKRGETIRALAKEYGLGKSTVWSAISGENWKHIV